MAGQKWRKRGFRLAWIMLLTGVLFAITTWFIFRAYVERHQDVLITKITEAIGRELQGKVAIKKLSPSWMATFPYASVQLDSIYLTDSLYQKRHHTKTLVLSQLNIEPNLFSLIKGEVVIRKIVARGGTLRFFTQEDGYSNFYLFKPRHFKEKEQKKAEAKPHRIPKIKLIDVRLLITHPAHFKRFDIIVKHLNLNLKLTGGSLLVKGPVDLMVYQLGFNVRKGGYLKNQEVKARLNLAFNLKEESLIFDKQKMKIGGELLYVSSQMDFGVSPARFNLKIQAPHLDFSRGLTMVPVTASRRFNTLKIEKPVPTTIALAGGFAYPDTPILEIKTHFINNKIETRAGSFEQVNFRGIFLNQVVPGKGKGDDNSGIFISQLSGKWMDIPLKVDTASIYNLLRPHLVTRVTGSFPSTKLNPVLGRSFAITKGDALLDLSFNGGVLAEDSIGRELKGFIRVNNTNLTYLPRHLKFNHSDAHLYFNKDSLWIKQLNTEIGASSVQIKGKADQFVEAFFRPDKQIEFDCQIKGDTLDINDFMPLLSARSSFEEGAGEKMEENTKGLTEFNRRFDDLLNKSRMTLDLDINKLIFENFKASHFKADMELGVDSMFLKRGRMEQSGGSLLIEVGFKPVDSFSLFQLHARLFHLDARELFASFSDFNQKSLTQNNIRGKLSAEVTLSGKVADGQGLSKKDLQGRVSYELMDGALIDFPPLLKIARFAFKKRGLDNVTIAPLRKDFEVNAGNLIFPKTTIQSSALNLIFQGVFDFNDKHTDLALEIPLSDPKKRSKNIKEDKKQPSKDLTLYLRARANEEGQVLIGWDYDRKKKSKQ